VIVNGGEPADDRMLAAAEPPRQAGPVVRPGIPLLGAGDKSEDQGPAHKAVREAERHFQYGRFCLQEGKPEEARIEFDRAMEVLLALPEDVPDRPVVEKKFEELVRQIHRYDVDSLGAGVQEDVPVFVQSPLTEMLDLTFPVDPRLKNKVAAQISATSSQLPLASNDAVLGYINFFANGRGSRILLSGMRRAGRYREMISRILAEEGVPQEMIFLAQAESGFLPRALSIKACAGMWQFARSRGREYGLDSARTFDMRLDPELATRAAARHLKDLYNRLGDWHLAMAAYNCGPLCVERAVQRTGYADYWELRRRGALPRETSNYVPVIMAMLIVGSNLEAYGLPPVEPEPALTYDTARFPTPTSLALVADSADVPVSEIRELNPSILRGVAPAGHEVRMPSGKGNAVLAALAVVPEDKRASWRLHRVGEGDTLASIARKYSAAPNAIQAANGRLDNAFFSAPEPGAVLLVPTRGGEDPEPKATRGVSAKKGKSGTTRRSSAPALKASAPAKAPATHVSSLRTTKAATSR
jgi:membrane-bound lytic murein transglycosylase D